MDIGSFSNAISTFKTNHTDLGKSVVKLKDNQLIIDKPLMPPSRWTSFLGSLSSSSVFGKWRSVADAKKTCDNYPAAAQEYIANNNDIRNGFIQALKAKHGDLTDLCTLPPINSKPLSAKTVTTTFAALDKASKNCAAQNSKRINTIADALIKEIVKKRPVSAKDDTAFLKKTILENCKKQAIYTQGSISADKVEAETTKALLLLSMHKELQKLPFLTSEKCNDFIAESNEKITSKIETNKLNKGNSKTELSENKKNIQEEMQPIINKALKENIRQNLRTDALKSTVDTHFNNALLTLNTTVPVDKSVIASEVKAFLESLSNMSAELISQQLCGKPNSRTSEIVSAIDIKISDTVKNAITENNKLHNQNLALLHDASCPLSDAQKNHLQEVGKQRPLNLELIQHSVNIAATLKLEVAGTGITDEQQLEVFKQVCELPDPQAALPKALILKRTKSMLDAANPNSTISQIALKNGVSGPVIQTISRAMLEHVKADNRSTAPGISREMEINLTAKIDAVLGQHVIALKAVNSSSIFSDEQKKKLGEISKNTPLNTVQIEHYEKLTKALKGINSTEGKSQASESQQPTIINTFESALNAIQENARPQWMAFSVGVSDIGAHALIQQLVFVAVAGLSKNEANTALEKLGSSLVIEPSLEVVSPTANAVWRPAICKLLQQSLRNQSQNFAELTATDFTSLTLMSTAQAPSQQLSTMLTRQDEIDVRGVTKKATTSSPVSADFRAGVVFSNMRAEILNHIKEEEAENGLSATMNKDIVRSRFSINGELINAALINGARKTPALETTIKTSFNSKLKISGASPETMKAISFCMNQNGINRFNEACTVQAMNGALGSEWFNIEHEAWQQADNSWLVRSSYSFKPAMISKEDGNIPIEGDGIGLYSLTYRITPQAEREPAQITLEGYTAAYDF
jgi:hypothetical protein